MNGLPAKLLGNMEWPVAAERGKLHGNMNRNVFLSPSTVTFLVLSLLENVFEC